jgi:hypothetical protein
MGTCCLCTHLPTVLSARLVKYYKDTTHRSMVIISLPGADTAASTVRLHCCYCAGRRNLALVTPDAFEAAACANAAWLEDVIMHLLCVLALDRFADYVSDQVSAELLPACCRAC